MSSFKAYVAGRTSDIVNVQKVQSLVSDRGGEITFDWTGDDGEIRSDWSEAKDKALQISTIEREAVAACDALILVWTRPDGEDRGPLGALLETGMALAAKDKWVIVFGHPRESVFWYLDNVIIAENQSKLEKAIEFVKHQVQIRENSEGFFR